MAWQKRGNVQYLYILLLFFKRVFKYIPNNEFKKLSTNRNDLIRARPETFPYARFIEFLSPHPKNRPTSLCWNDSDKSKWCENISSKITQLRTQHWLYNSTRCILVSTFSCELIPLRKHLQIYSKHLKLFIEGFANVHTTSDSKTICIQVAPY